MEFIINQDDSESLYNKYLSGNQRIVAIKSPTSIYSCSAIGKRLVPGLWLGIQSCLENTFLIQFEQIRGSNMVFGKSKSHPDGPWTLKRAPWGIHIRPIHLYLIFKTSLKLFSKIMLEELDFCLFRTWFLLAFEACKNHVQNRLKIKFVQLDLVFSSTEY